MKFFHLADVHLGAEPDKGCAHSGERAREIWETFREVLARAGREGADCIFISGDLFHRQPLVRELREVDYLFSRIPDVRIFLMAGNHDCQKPGSAYERFVWSPNVTFFHGERPEAVCAEELKLTVWGHSYRTREITEPLYDGLRPDGGEGLHVLMAHGGDGRHIPMDYRRIRDAGFDYVALGHIHRPGIFEGYPMAYAGALEPIDRNDTGPHGYIEGILEPKAEGGRRELRFVPAARRSYVELTAQMQPGMTAGELESWLAERMLEEGKDNLFSVCIRGCRDAWTVPDEGRIRRLGNVAAVTDRSRIAYDYEELKRRHRGQLIGRFLESYGDGPLSEAEERSRMLGMEALLEGSL